MRVSGITQSTSKESMCRIGIAKPYAKNANCIQRTPRSSGSSADAEIISPVVMREYLGVWRGRGVSVVVVVVVLLLVTAVVTVVEQVAA